MTSTTKHRALFYTRDSGGRHENTPGQYVVWAANEARKRGLEFDGTPVGIQAMVKSGESHRGDLFLDYGVSGNVLERPGLNSLMNEASKSEVTTIFIPRRDRLARPNRIQDAMAIEGKLRQFGVSLVFMDSEALPISRGQTEDFGEFVTTAYAYHAAGKFRRDLATKMILAQTNLARMGFSTGGRPPYGFRRFLIGPTLTEPQQLSDGERIKKPGHNVVWLPSPPSECDVIKRILELLVIYPASQVAKILNEDGVPSPNAGKFRTDNGVRHRVTGRWNQSSVLNVARNPLLRAIVVYGRRSYGDQLRFAPDGPRELADSDFRIDDSPKAVRNPIEVEIHAKASFAPVVDVEEHMKLLRKLDERSGTQRGKPRSRDPNRNPLGASVFDLKCGWPMYRQPYAKSFRYTCGLYQQTHGKDCEHNHVDGMDATRFALNSLCQILLDPTCIEKLEARVRELANRDNQQQVGDGDSNVARIRNRLASIEGEMKQVSRNLAYSKTESAHDAVATVLRDLDVERKRLNDELDRIRSRSIPLRDGLTEVERTLNIIRSMTDLANQSTDLGSIRRLLEIAKCRLYLNFEKKEVGRRKLNRLACGMITFGDVSSPRPLYEGPTGRRALKSRTVSICSSRNDQSLGNVSWGDCPSFEPWIANLVDAVFSPTSESASVTRVLRLIA